MAIAQIRQIQAWPLAYRGFFTRFATAADEFHGVGQNSKSPSCDHVLRDPSLDFDVSERQWTTTSAMVKRRSALATGALRTRARTHTHTQRLTRDTPHSGDTRHPPSERRSV